MHVGLGDLDVVQPHDGIDVDRVRLGALAHDLPMHLALGRHVDDEIAADLRLAAEPAARRSAARACRHSAARPRSTASTWLGARRRCACLANSPSAISIWQRQQMPRPPQTESRSTPSLRAASSTDDAVLELAALARGREDDAMLGQSISPARAAGLRAARRPRPRPAARDRRLIQARNWDRGPSPRRRRGSPAGPRGAAGS